MEKPVQILILGASYGSLLATKLSAAGHHSTLVCRSAERDLINKEGTRIRLPIRVFDTVVELQSKNLPGEITAISAQSAQPSQYDLVVLAMQEPQYAAPPVKTLLEKIGAAGVPCLSIMNIPPIPYLARIRSIAGYNISRSYSSASAWAVLDPALITLASLDPQAFRPPNEPENVLQVGLPTNFKVAPFEKAEHNQILNRLQNDIETVRYDLNGQSVELPVKLKVHDSIYVPLAKWCMLIAGNYRCVQDKKMRSIKDAVHSDIKFTSEIYRWVGKVCTSMGASPEDLVPFEKYASAAHELQHPSSAARALLAGAKNIERVDKLVQQIGAARGLRNDELDNIVARIDSWLAKNREIETA